MNTFASLIELLGRFCIAAIFVLSGINKILSWNENIAFMQSQGMVMYTQLFLIGAILVEIAGGLCIAFGYRTSLFATLLALYLIPVTYIFHHFWTIVDPAAKQMQTIEFLKNLAIFGGLLVLSSTAIGRFRVRS